MIQLKINNITVELSEGERIALTKPNTRIGDIGNRRGHFTNDFKVKGAADTLAVLGLPDRLESSANVPQTKQDSILYLKNSIEIARGFTQLAGFDWIKNEVTLTFYAGQTPWTEQIRDRSIRDLWLRDLDHDWTAANIEASWDNENGYIYPWIDYGRINEIKGTAADPMLITDWYPAVYQKRVIRQIFEEIGYKVAGSFTDSWEWHQTIVPFSGPGFEAADGTVFVPGDTVTLAPNLPELKQGDFVKDMAVRHGLVVTTDEATKTVYFHSFDYVAGRIFEAQDWSGKVDLATMREVDYTEVVKKYGAGSWFRYGDVIDDDLALKIYERLAKEPHADGKISITNDFIEDTVDVYTSIFSPTIMGKAMFDTTASPFKSVNMPGIPFLNELDEVSYAPNPRILYYAGKYETYEFGYWDSSRYYITDWDSSSYQFGSEMPFSFFTKYTISGRNAGPTEVDSVDINSIDRQLSFNKPNYTQSVTGTPASLADYISVGAGLLETWYGRFNRILNRPRYLEISIYLKDHEFFDIDFARPVYIHSGQVVGYFYIDIVEDYDGSGPAKVGLIQIV